MCSGFLYILSATFPILKRTERDDIGLHVQYRYVYRSACTVPLCISVCMYSTVMYIGLHVQYRYCWQVLMELEFL